MIFVAYSQIHLYFKFCVFLSKVNKVTKVSIKLELKRTRLSSNLRSTTRECVHLVTRCHFWSRDKDGSHTIRSAIAENPMIHDKLRGSIFYKTGVMADRSLRCGEFFLYFFAAVTLTLTR